jgi:hypothetical protein
LLSVTLMSRQRTKYYQAMDTDVWHMLRSGFKIPSKAPLARDSHLILYSKVQHSLQ